MKFKLNLPTLFILVCIASTFVPIFYPIDIEQKGLELPQCVDEPVVTTVVNFFVSQDVISHFSIDDIKNELDFAIQKGNQILTNSCIPMRRELGNIQTVDFSQYALYDINQVDRTLQQIVGKPVIEQIRRQPNHYYGVLLGKNDNYFDDEFCGEADVDENDQFFLISYDADEFTIEHELGHLAWAQHYNQSWFSHLDDSLKQGTSEKNQYMLKPYAHGFKCAGTGTLMSHEYDILPVYSSPDIYYEGKVCGDAEKADNARMMREYARRLRQKIAEAAG